MKHLFPILLLAAFLFAGCSDDDTPVIITPGKTILVYMAGDNSLNSYTKDNLTSIIAGSKNAQIEKCNLLIYLDAGNLPKLYKIAKNEQGIVDSVLVKTYKNPNSVDIDVMNEVITEVFEDYPAEEKGLFLWSHGTAWLPSDYSNYLRSFGQDGRNHMEITELKEALPEGLLDYIIFDACYMASAEVVYELKDKANYIMGSSTEILGEGFPYTLTIPGLLADEVLEDRLAKTAASFYNYYNIKSGDYRTGNISLIRTSELNALATACRSILAGRYGQMIDPSQYGLNLQALEYLTKPLEYSFLYDFKDYIAAMGGETDLKAVVYKNTTPASYFAQPGRSMPIDRYSGLSIYVPQAKNAKMNEWYKRLDWYKAVYE